MTTSVSSIARSDRIEDSSEVLDATREGRIEHLFIGADSRKADDLTLDLLNNAVLSAICNSGTVSVTAAPEVKSIALAEVAIPIKCRSVSNPWVLPED